MKPRESITKTTKMQLLVSELSLHLVQEDGDTLKAAVQEAAVSCKVTTCLLVDLARESVFGAMHSFQCFDLLGSGNLVPACTGVRLALLG